MSLKMLSMAVVSCSYSYENEETFSKPHVTLSFGDVKDISVSADQLAGPLPASSIVTSIEHFAGPDLTVAILDPQDWAEVREVYNRVGLDYKDYDFKPHITICKGNKVDKYKDLVGRLFIVLDVIFKIKDFK